MMTIKKVVEYNEKTYGYDLTYQVGCFYRRDLSWNEASSSPTKMPIDEFIVFDTFEDKLEAMKCCHYLNGGS